MFLSRVAALLLVLGVTLGQRVYWLVSGNPLDVFAVGFVVVAMILWIADSAVNGSTRPYRGYGIKTIGPLFALLIALPFFGVLAGWYEITVLYVWMIVAIPLGILSLGRAAYLHGLRLDRIAFTLILVHGVYGLGQTLARVGAIPASVWLPFAEWDAFAQRALSDAYVISNRSTGLFINANSFGYWSCSAILVGAVLLKGWPRYVAIILGIAGVVGSQSRTAWVGLALLVFWYLFAMLRNGRLAGRFFISAVVLTPVILVGWMSGIFNNFIESNLVERLTSGFGVVSDGIDADTNLSARADAWGEAYHFVWAEYPFGTFGPPQALFGGFIDNQYVSLFVQGGLILVAAYILALCSPFILARHGMPLAGMLGLATALVAVFSFTMQPVDSPSASSLVWLLAAASIAAAHVKAKRQGSGLRSPRYRGRRSASGRSRLDTLGY